MRRLKWPTARSIRTNRFFPVLGIVLFVIAVTIAVTGVLFLFKSSIQNWLEVQIVKILQAPETTQPPKTLSKTGGETNAVSGQPPAMPVEEVLHYETFYDVFSGVGWINEERTTFYHDFPMTAFLLPSKYTFERTTETSAVSFLERKSDGSDERCLPAQAGIGNHCLKQKDSSLFFDGSPVPLPSELSGVNIVNISIGRLDTYWLVGVVAKNDGQYSGWVFVFDSHDFRNVNRDGKELFSSQYGGRVGFGGSDKDWLAVYGAYEGKAFHVRNGAAEDISRFFGIRVMDGGFEPEVTKIGSAGDPTWYVWNRKGVPKLVKLFQNGTGEINGATDLSLEVISAVGGADEIDFVPAAEPRSLIAKVTHSGTTQFWKFTDDGFDIPTSKEIFSSNLTDRGKPVVLASIANLELSDYGGQFELFLSNDDINWQKMKIGETVRFPNKDGDKVFWRLKADPPKSRFASPYFGQIEVRYAWKDK